LLEKLKIAIDQFDGKQTLLFTSQPISIQPK